MAVEDMYCNESQKVFVRNKKTYNGHLLVVCYIKAVPYGGWCNRWKIFQFLLSFNLGKITLLYKYEPFFFLKTGNLIINWFSYKHTVLEKTNLTI